MVKLSVVQVYILQNIELNLTVQLGESCRRFSLTSMVNFQTFEFEILAYMMGTEFVRVIMYV